jgi:hypothetical protein
MLYGLIREENLMSISLRVFRKAYLCVGFFGSSDGGDRLSNKLQPSSSANVLERLRVSLCYEVDAVYEVLDDEMSKTVCALYFLDPS